MKKKCLLSIILIVVLLGLGVYVKSKEEKKSCDVKTFTAFFSVSGNIRDEDNEIRELIAERIGAAARSTGSQGRQWKMR